MIHITIYTKTQKLNITNSFTVRTREYYYDVSAELFVNMYVNLLNNEYILCYDFMMNLVYVCVYSEYQV